MTTKKVETPTAHNSADPIRNFTLSVDERIRALTIGAQKSAKTIDERLVRAAAADLAPRSRTVSLVKTAAITAGFALLTLVGAAAGAFVFRSNVAALVEQWQALPAVPPAPQPELAPTIAAPPAPRQEP